MASRNTCPKYGSAEFPSSHSRSDLHENVPAIDAPDIQSPQNPRVHEPTGDPSASASASSPAKPDPLQSPNKDPWNLLKLIPKLQEKIETLEKIIEEQKSKGTESDISMELKPIDIKDITGRPNM